MIRDKNKIYGEVNSEYTVIVEPDLIPNKYVISAGSRKLKPFNPGPRQIMITDANGNASAFSYNQTNKLVGVDANGNLALFPKVPTTPPASRALIADIWGSTNPGAELAMLAVELRAPYYYEVEVIGAGGGGGAGVGRSVPTGTILHGTDGGDGGYYKGIFLVPENITAILRPGNSGSRGQGLIHYLSGGNSWTIGNNWGGYGGRSAVLYPNNGNHGLASVYNINYSSPDPRLGGSGINGGASGGYTRMETGVGTQVIGVGGSGGGANGPYGGAGGNSYYMNNEGLVNACSGGAGGAGGGFGLGGDGGEGGETLIGAKGLGYGGGGGGTGLAKPDGNYFDLSAGGGGGGGGSIFVCGNIQILCGGGGGGAGSGYGGLNKSTYGGHGTNNINDEIGGAHNGGTRGFGINLALMTQYSHDCRGTDGGPGRIRIWRCV